MVNHGPYNDFIMVFDGWPWTIHGRPSKTIKTMVTMVDYGHHFAWVAQELKNSWFITVSWRSFFLSVWKCCMPVYIEMPRKITASHILFVAVSITTSKGFALYGCLCTHTFKYKFFWGEWGWGGITFTQLWKNHIYGGLYYCCCTGVLWNTEDLGQLAKVLSTTE